MKTFMVPVFHKIASLVIITVTIIYIIGGTVYAVSECPSGMSDLDCQAITGNWTNWIPDDASNSCTGNADATLIGSDNATKTWNFLISKGLDATHAAAVMGNLQQESSFNPIIMQKGGTSKNPSDADPLGWGIAQWTPGSKVVGIAQNLNVATPIYELGSQLNVVWNEMTGTAPTGYKNFLTDFNKTLSLSDATEFFRAHFEGGTAGKRQTFAQEALAKYGGSDDQTNSSGALINTGCSSISPDCISANGVAKIVCSAKKYDTVSYVFGDGHNGAATWHQDCQIVGPSCSLDCSGLVNIAVYDAFGNDLNEDTATERSDASQQKNWTYISFKDVQPGDLIQPNSHHVEIIDYVQGNIIHTFGAHVDGIPQPDQVGPSTYTVGNSTYKFLHYIGPGV